MADRYFRQITATGGKYATNTTANWSATSGGSGGASIPTSADNVFFDANSGVGSTLSNALITCLNYDSTGYAGTFDPTGNTVSAFGNVTLGVDSTNIQLTMSATSGTKTITPTSPNLGSLTINGAGGTFTLAGNLAIVGLLTVTNGTFDANGKNISFDSIALGSGTKTITFGSGNWTVGSTGTGTKWNFSTNKTGLTVNGGTGRIIVNNGASAMTFAVDNTQQPGGILDFRGTGIVTVTGGASFNGIAFSADCSVKFTAGITMTVVYQSAISGSGISGGGTSGHLATLQTTSAGSAATIAISNTPPDANMVVDFMSIKDVTLTGHTLYATNSTNVSGNTNIVFAAPDPGFMTIRDC